jgi:serine/threonine protein kinase
MPPDSPSSGLAASQHGVPPRLRDVLLASGLVAGERLDEVERELRSDARGLPEAGDIRAWDKAVAAACVEKRLLTRFQARELLAGRRRFTLGNYRVLDEIGQGGMGQVFKAEHMLMGRIVAIKVLPLSKSTPRAEAAFQREIRMLARFDHENIVRALDAGYDGNVHYLVTEYVSGADLRRHVARHGPLDQWQAAAVITQAARGLAYAHDRGVIHRDIKPGNILVTRDGRAKVLDLGLAGSLFDPESMGTGRRVGTPGYMAPEQILSSRKVGPVADIYGLGCTLYFAVTGQPPFPGETREEKERRQQAGNPPAILALAPDLEQDFAALIEAMMRPSPRERIATANEVIERLRPWFSGATVPLPGKGSGRQPRTRESSTTISPAAGSGLSGSEFVSGSEAHAGADTLQDAAETDDTFVGRWPGSSPHGPPGDSFGTVAGVARRAAKACLLALPLSVVAGFAAGVARFVFPNWGPSPGWAAVMVFFMLAGGAFAVAPLGNGGHGPRS